MRRTTLVLVTGLFATACGSSGMGEPQDDPHDGGNTMDGGGDGTGSGSGSGSGAPDELQPRKSGTRIKMLVLTTPDGAKTLMGWRDTMLNLDCTFMMASDNVTRCLPANVPYRNSAYFGDAACTLPAFFTQAYDNPAATYALEPDFLGFPYKYRAHRKGNAITTLYFKNGASCTVTSVPAGGSAFLTNGEVAPATFQSGTIAVE